MRALRLLQRGARRLVQAAAGGYVGGVLGLALLQ
jgi:hypothetical protein